MSTFYHRTSRVPSVRAVADAVVAERIEEIWQQSRRSYGAPRIHAMLAREGIRVGRKRVERLMRGLGIQGAHLHKHWKTTRPDRRVTAAPDLVERQFQAAAPNTLWVADLTYIKTLQGILYLAVVLDVFSRRSRGREFKSRQPDSEVLAVPTSSESRRVRICCGRRGCSGLAALGLAARVLASLRAAALAPKTYCFASSRTLIRD
jgi:transposase InsO family protein